MNYIHLSVKIDSYNLERVQNGIQKYNFVVSQSVSKVKIKSFSNKLRYLCLYLNIIHRAIIIKH